MTTALPVSHKSAARPALRSASIAWGVRAAGACVFVALLTAWVSYNRLVRSAEEADAAWAQVANVMQRRADLLPNLVAVTAGYAEHERALLDSVSAARAAYTTAASLIEKIERMRRLEAMTSRMLATDERYPELKASPVYAGLRFELLGTENRIAIERGRYNDAVRRLRTMRRSWPASIVARVFALPDPPAY